MFIETTTEAIAIKKQAKDDKDFEELTLTHFSKVKMAVWQLYSIAELNAKALRTYDAIAG